MDERTPPPADAPDREVWHRPVYDRLALHRWEMGQVLHEAQFRAQEEALLQHIGLRAQLAGLPSYGVALLQWNQAQLAQGDLSVHALTAVLPSGRLIVYPGNAELTARNLGLPPKPTGPVPVYLHVRPERRPDDARDLQRYQDDGPQVRRTIHQLELSTVPGVESGQESLQLAELEFADGAWALGPHVPALLRLGRGTTPFLRDLLDHVMRSIAEFESELVKRAADAVTGAEQLSDVRRVLIAIYRVQAVMMDHGYGGATQTVSLHPYHLFAALRDFYLEAVVLQGKALDAWPLRYRHDNLRASFEPLAVGLARGLEVPTVVSTRLPFHRDEYWFVAGPFPEELCAAGDVFLLVERPPHAPPPDPAARSPVDDIKLASPLRTEEVYTKALAGVPRTSLPSLGFEQTFGHRAQVFQLDSRSREWKEAVRERALCFAVQPGLEGYSAALFWQRPAGG